MIRERPAVQLLRHLAEVWPAGDPFLASTVLTQRLADRYPESWGHSSPYGRPLTVQRLGRMLVQGYRINSSRQDSRDKRSPRGYHRPVIDVVLRRMQMTPPGGTGGSGGSGGTGGNPSSPWQSPPVPPAPPVPPVPPGGRAGTSVECRQCTKPADPRNRDGMCGSVDRHHLDALRALGGAA